MNSVRRNVLLVLMALVAFIVTGMQDATAQNYDDNWEKVDALVKKGRPRSALNIVDEIYTDAKSNDNTPQIVKSLIYRASLQSKYEENHIRLSIQEFLKNIETATFPEKQILHSLTAELYNAYLMNNRWVINKRQVVIDDNSKDITTWDIVRFNKEIDFHYTKSLINKDRLSEIRLGEFYPILQDGDSSNTTVFPFLYDLLANRAINYYSSSDYEMLFIGNPVIKSAKKYIVSADEFILMDINTIVSPIDKVMALFQYLTILHKKESNIEALIDVDLRRLKFAYNNTNGDMKTSNNYLDVLSSLAKQHRNNPVYVSVAYELANQYYILGGNYSPVFSPKSKYYYVTADSICEEAITGFPQVDGINKCQNLKERINNVNLSFQIPVAQIPGKPTLSLVEFKNIEKLFFKIVEGDPLANSDRYNRKEYIQNELRKKEVISWVQELPQTNDKRKHTVEIKIPELDQGYYIVFVSDDPFFNTAKTIKYQPIWISDLSYITKQNQENGTTDMFVTDRETGRSIGDVDITIYQQQYDNKNRKYIIRKIGNTTTDDEGYVSIKSMGSSNYGTYIFEFNKENDRLFSENYLNFFRNQSPSKPIIKTYLFTDRAVYRPGQTVYFKGIITEKLNNSVSLLTDQPIELNFTNASRKNIGTLKLKSNEAGSIDGFFVIPSDGMSGNMTITTKSGSVGFLVEEYKRPTFKVLFDTLGGQPRIGETVVVTGNAMGYAGNSINNANVKYRVVRKVAFPIPYYRDYFWIPPGISRDIEIANGLVKTNDKGEFSIRFESLIDESVPESVSPEFTYDILAEVTDITGETHTSETSVKLGYNSVNLTIDASGEIDLMDFDIPSIMAMNLTGKYVNVNTTISLYKLTPTQILLNNRLWNKPEFNLIPEDEFRNLFPHEPYKDDSDPLSRDRELIVKRELLVEGKTIIPEEIFIGLEPGEYLITVNGKDKHGKNLEANHIITVFSSKGKKMPSNKINWWTVSKNQAEPGETVKLILGSSAKKSRILYEIIVDGKSVQQGWVNLNKGQKIIEIPVKENYRGNFTITVAMVKFNRFYSKNFNIVVPFTNKILDVKLTTFRSYLTPGMKEEWKVSISGKNGNPISAELLAGMYDASLDIYRENYWRMNLFNQRGSSTSWESNQFHSSTSAALFVPDTRYFSVTSTNYPVINWYGYYLMGNNPIAYDNIDVLYRKSVIADEPMGLAEAETSEAEIKSEIEEEVEKKEPELIPLRTNFNETAFFYPNLKSDETGTVSFSFTTPDALTEWKIRMLAYTSDLKTGTLEKSIKSRKDLMIIPNLPRFVRQGDTLLFSAKVVNYSDQDLLATTNIEFYNPLTMEIISILIGGENQRINKIPLGQSALVSWNIAIPENLDMLAYRLTSNTDNYSDGEERMFPVLTNRVLVTNTLPMNVGSRSNTDFSFESLSKSEEKSTIRNYSYTVEFTSNPSWYAVQALPYLSTPENQNNIALFNVYLANSLSSFIVNSNPQLKAIFESWRSLTPDALVSNLEKNSELKSSIISASPWLLDAQDETEQKRRIGVLFDVSRMSQEKQNIINKLMEAQLPSGAWPWFKGMHEDRHSTQSIVTGLAKLHHKGVLDLQSDKSRLKMVRKSVNWLDNQIVSDYNQLKNNNPELMKKYQPSSSQVQYLYLRSLLKDIVKITGNTRDAIDYFMGQSKKFWLNQSNMLQGMTAMTLYRFGHRNESEAIVRSLKERSIFHKEMGMYWRQADGWNWYQAPVETQVMMIETMAELDNNLTLVEQLKIWLLKQKQVQNWKTSTATAEAVYALLMYGNNSLAENKPVKVFVGGNDVSEEKDIEKEAGTGWFSTSWTGSEITPELSNITIDNPNNNIAWGAAYWQYFDDMDKVESHNSPLSLKKRLFVERYTDNGPVLEELSDNMMLNKGDKIVVRLEITSDRNMEYIHLKDMRASAFEPAEQLSGYSYSGGLWYYKDVSDVSMDFFIKHLQKGTYIIDYPLFVTQSGNFNNGIATIQNMYAPEFSANSSGVRVVVK